MCVNRGSWKKQEPWLPILSIFHVSDMVWRVIEQWIDGDGRVVKALDSPAQVQILLSAFLSPFTSLEVR